MSQIQAWTLPELLIGDARAARKVFDAEPALDLLERAHEVFKERKIGPTPLTVEVEAQLRAHGRLGGET